MAFLCDCSRLYYFTAITEKKYIFLNLQFFQIQMESHLEKSNSWGHQDEIAKQLQFQNSMTRTIGSDLLINSQFFNVIQVNVKNAQHQNTIMISSSLSSGKKTIYIILLIKKKRLKMWNI